MTQRQTTIQNIEAIKKGSTRVLVGNDFDSLVDVGALRNANFTSLAENQSINFDNVAPLQKFVRGSRVQFTFDLAEINFDNLAVLDAGIVAVQNIAGTLISGEEQEIEGGSWNYSSFTPFSNQNGDGSEVVVNSITAENFGALTQDTDFVVVENNGVWGIIILETGSVLDVSEAITINYDYTPNEAKRLTFTEQGNKILKAMRIINRDENNKIFKIDIADGTNFAPISLDFAGDEEEDVAIMPVDFQGVVVDFLDEQ